MKSILGGKAVVTFAACHKMDFDMVSVNVIIVLQLLLMIIGSIVRVVVFLMLFILLEAFAILVKLLLVIVQFFGVLFLLAMIRGWLVALLCVCVDVRLSSLLDRVLQYSQFAIHFQVCQLLLLASVWWYLLYAILSSISLLVFVSRLFICLSQRVFWSALSSVSILPGLNGFIMVSIRFLGCSIRAVLVGFLVWSVIWPREIRVAGLSRCT